MTRLLDSIGLWFTDYYLLSAVLLLLALIALRLSRQPIHRLTIVKSTLVALALLAGLCALPGWSVVHLLTAEAPAAAQPPSSKAILDAPDLQQLIQATSGNPTAARPRTTAAPAPSINQPTRRASWTLSWHATLAAAQLAGACLVLIWLALGILAARRLRFSAAPASAELQALLARLSPTTTVDLRASNHITVPVALGILRPAILLPLPFSEGPSCSELAVASPGSHSALPTPHSPLTSILAHELAHIRNHDLHWLAVSRALMILLWSQPLYWLARRRMRLDQESLADAAAAEVSSREQYAEQLVSWARNLGSRPTMRIASAVGLWEGPSQLRQRIAILLDERFIILRHFSRKLQLAAVALCALTAAALSLVTLEPAQSKPQEKPAVSANTSSDSVKTNEPDHITIDDRFILCPVTTELQRSLLGDVDAPRSSASLCIFANYAAYQGDAIEADSKFFAGLSERLAALAKRDNRYVIASVQVSQSQISQPFEKLRARAEQLSKLIEKRSRDAGFKKGTWSVTFGTTLGWSENAANAEAAAKLAESNVEDSIGNEQVRIFPVRTFLSRMLMQDADCIINIRPIWQKDDGPNFVDSFVPSLKEFIPKLKFVSKKLMYVRVRFAGDAQSFVDQWSGNLERSKKFGQELGFADSRNQQAGVSDEDAKQDKEARTANPARPAEPIARPELKPSTIAGRVVDDKDAPIPGAEVFLFWVKQSDLSREQIAQTKTNDQGNYRFDIATEIAKEFPNGKLPPLHDLGDRYLQSVIRAPGRTSEWSLEAPQMVAQQGRWHQSKMLPAATLEGRVTGPDGKPVADAIVGISNGSLGTWEGANLARTNGDGYYLIIDAPQFDLEKYKQQLAEREARARALAADGREAWDFFAFKPTVSVSHADFAQLYSEIQHSPGTQNFRLKSPAILEGRVTFPDGKPTAGAVVTASTSYEVGADGKAINAPQQFYSTIVVADDNGHYRISSLPADKYNIWADTPDWVNVGATALATTTDKSTTAPDLVMTKGGIVRVRLVDATTKQPIAVTPNTRAMIIVAQAPPSAGGRIPPQNYVNANTDGRFERRATPGEKLIAVGAVDVDGELKWYCNERFPVKVIEGETVDLDVPVTDSVSQPTGRVVEREIAQPAANPIADVQRDPEAVLKAANEALEKNPDDLAALLQHADALYELGRDRLALDDYQQLLKLDLEPPVALAVNNNLALLLAASPNERLRDGKRAVELAKKAVGLQDPPPHQALDTLAAAYAEAGDFDQAVKTQEQAIAAAPESYREEYEGYVKQYKAHQPRREAKDTDDDAATPKEKDGASSPSTPQQRKRVALSKVGESLISTTDDKSADATAQFLVEPRSPDQDAQQDSSAVASLSSQSQTASTTGESKKSSSSSVEGDSKGAKTTTPAATPAYDLAHLQVRVADEAGQPVANATVFASNVRIDGTDLHRVTDAKGIAQVPFPRVIVDKMHMTSVGVHVQHPDFVTLDASAFVSSKRTTLKLTRGGTVKIEAVAKDAPDDIGLVYAVVNKLDPTTRWSRPADRVIQSPPLTVGEHTVRAVAYPAKSAALFSDTQQVNIAAGTVQESECELKPGWRFSGRLDGQVPRPVVNGLVMLTLIATKEDASWSDWTTINADGTFVFDSLPREAGAEIKLTAVCNGFVSKTPEEIVKKMGVMGSQKFPFHERNDECVLEMVPAAKCIVTVQDTKKKPLRGVKVWISPALAVEGGTSAFGHPSGMKDILQNNAYREIPNHPALPYHAESNEEGIVELSNLPPFASMLFAASEQYELPQNPLYGAFPMVEVELRSGEITRPTLTMLASAPAVSTTGASAASPAVAPGEIAGIVIDSLGQPLAGVTVDAWTWCPGNETTTDKDGRFFLKGFEPNESVEIEFRKEGYAPNLFPAQTAGTPNWNITLTNDTYLEGKMLDAAGRPVADAIIRAERGPFENPQVTITEVPTETKTDKDGHYRLYLAPDTYDIKIRAPERGVARLEQTIAQGDERSLDIKLEEGITFRARVLDSETKQPVQGITLWNWQHSGIEGTSNAEGLLEVPAMFLGNFEFSVTATGENRRKSSLAGDYARWWSAEAVHEYQRANERDRHQFQGNFDSLEFAIGKSTEPVTIYVERCVTITGHVLDPDGKPVAGVTVAPAKTGSGNSLTGDTRFSVETKEDGTFEMRLPASGDREYNLIAHDGKYQEWRKWANGAAEQFRTNPGDRLQDIELKLARPAIVRGSVTTGDGSPAADTEVRAADFHKHDNRYYVPTTKTDDKGNFELKFASPGKHYIQVAPFWLDADQAPPGTSVIVELQAGETKEQVTLKTEPEVDVATSQLPADSE